MPEIARLAGQRLRLTSTFDCVEIIVVRAQSGWRADANALFHVPNQVSIAGLRKAFTGAFVFVPVFGSRAELRLWQT